ncbi:MAG: hypothetical protein LQ338_002880 [Usnochroma carphineum]|nr:MAG: hypothetical protein LQ338_002880 [Usnochroma carphineum]
MATKARTHDISLIDSHVKDVKTLCEILSQAVSAAFPRAGGSRYRNANVLLLSWENDDLGVATEVDELDEIFRDVYRYQTDQWRIPSNKSHNALVRRIMQALEKAESVDELLVVYYGGHGYMNEDRQCVWLCNQQPEAATLQWSSIQTMLEEADSDVLILLDCCAAASSAGGSGKGITELIAACGFEAFAPGVGEHSFTRSLVEELRYYGQRPGPISTAFLHNKVLARAKKSWNPRYARDGTQERRRTPIHIHLADRSKQRCIELAPLPTPTIPAPSETSTNAPSSALSTSPSEDVDMSDPNSPDQSPLSEVSQDPQPNLPKVLISIALEEEQSVRTENIRDWMAWVDWIRSVPPGTGIVRVESVYKSDSTLLLLSLPVAVWDLLPKDPAISFISFVRSRNLMHPEGLTQQMIKDAMDSLLPTEGVTPQMVDYLGYKRRSEVPSVKEDRPSTTINYPSPPRSNISSTVFPYMPEPSMSNNDPLLSEALLLSPLLSYSPDFTPEMQSTATPVSTSPHSHSNPSRKRPRGYPPQAEGQKWHQDTKPLDPDNTAT